VTHASLLYLSVADVRRLVLAEVDRAGGFAALARELGVSVQYVHRCATTDKAPSGKLLALLGLRKAVIEVYLPAQGAAPQEQAPCPN
jgi:hypothetical protein